MRRFEATQLAVPPFLAPALVVVAQATTASAYPQVRRPYEKWAKVSGVKYYRTPTHVEGKSLAPSSMLRSQYSAPGSRVASSWS